MHKWLRRGHGKTPEQLAGPQLRPAPIEPEPEPIVKKVKEKLPPADRMTLATKFDSQNARVYARFIAHMLSGDEESYKENLRIWTTRISEPETHRVAIGLPPGSITPLGVSAANLNAVGEWQLDTLYSRPPLSMSDPEIALAFQKRLETRLLGAIGLTELSVESVGPLPEPQIISVIEPPIFESGEILAS